MRRVLDGFAWLWGRLLCLIKFHELIGQLQFVDKGYVGHFTTVTRCARCKYIFAASDMGIRYMLNTKDKKWYLWNAERNFEYPMPDNLARIVSGEASGLISENGVEGLT